ncbi:MAG: type I-C CRISPR-associated protein Cas8c/Csd1 [Dehalococcoidia bacterium]|nr:type I-C CRISPR-associated protein Cas8c/Csd1 [Dehalococcoidia bacterium]
MILQALLAYYRRLAEEGGIAPQGFKKVEIPFLIILNNHGGFAGLQDTRTQVGKKLVARSFVVPAEQGRSGSKSWQTANLLWDHYGYVLGWPKADSDANREMARKQHQTFVAKIKSLHERFQEDKEIDAVHRFLAAGDFTSILSDPLWPECAKISGCNLSFRIEERLRLVCENENVGTYVSSAFDAASDDADDISTQAVLEGMCLISGEYGLIARLHHRTPIPGAKSNAKIVSFQKNMGFDSYGKLQSYNAPVGEKAMFGYTTALNHMLARSSRQKLQVGDATTVFWAERKHGFEGAFADIFGEPAKGEPEQDYKSLIALFRSPETGARPELDPTTRFFVLGLAPNAARISVRFWWAGTVGEIAENIGQHFDDLETIKGPKEWRRITLKSLLRSTALQEKDDNVSPNLAGDTMKAILAGTPYPQTLLASAIRRCRAEQSVHYTRVALIKAILTRETRYYKRNHKEVAMSLDITNTNPGYLLGRLFAVLEKIQEEASPGINATIRDRFYGAASGTPVTAFPQLMKLKNHHLAKLENRGRAVNLEKQIGEIVDKLDAGDSFPSHLSLPDQGRFAVGYYHQRQAFFTKKEKEEQNG